MSVVVPNFLNEALIEKALQNYHKTSNNNAAHNNTITIESMNFGLSSASGENYCSDIYVVKVKYSVNGNTFEKSFFVKVMYMEIVKFGSSEHHMYTKVLPTMETIIRDALNNEVTVKFHAKCLLCECLPQEFYILEDLNAAGYYCTDRTNGLEETHAKLLMRRIAQFHAASMVYGKRFPSVADALQKSHLATLDANDPWIQYVAFGGLEYVANLVENWDGYGQIAAKIRAIIPRFIERMAAVVDPQQSAFNVINHGDLWSNNFLFKYKDDKRHTQPIDIVFVDFQTSFWGSPGCDINYFLNTSLPVMTLKEKRLELLHLYYDTFKHTLEDCAFPESAVPSWEALVAEVKRCEFVGFYCSLCELPVCSMSKETAQGFTLQSICNPEFMAMKRKLLYDGNPRVIETLKYSLKYFDLLVLE